MGRLREVLQVAVPFVWFGMVVAISGIEAPLKFRAPGITQALGLGIGRLVFRALNWGELLLLVVLAAVLVTSARAGLPLTLTGVLGLILLTQMFVLRPLLDERAQVIIAGGVPTASSLHLVYIALEGAKLLLLPWLGAMLVLRLVGSSS
ncbi:MAG TPA: hypothetical protein VGD43_23705 [Micromonospora sp.]